MEFNVAAGIFHPFATINVLNNQKTHKKQQLINNIYIYFTLPSTHLRPVSNEDGLNQHRDGRKEGRKCFI